MAFLTKPKLGTTLTEAVANKASALRVEESFQKDAGRNFQTAASQAYQEAYVAGVKAEAVEQALELLEGAGVDL